MQIFGLIILRSTQSLISFFMNILIMDTAFDKRHGITLWTWYFGIKTILLVFFENADALSLSGIPVNGLHIFFILTTAVASYAVLYYTWKGDFLQIGCVALLSDIFCGSAFIIASAMVNIVSGYTWQANLIGKDPVVAVPVIIAAPLLFLLLLHPVRPYLRRLGQYSFRRRRLAASGIILLISSLSLSQITDIDTFTTSHLVSLAVMAVLMFSAGIYLSLRIPGELQRRISLRHQAALADAYDLMIRTQTAELASQQQFLSETASRLQTDTGRSTAEMQTYLTEMQAVLEKLRCGRYSADPALDTVLSFFADLFAGQGIGADFQASVPQEASGQAAELGSALLHWVQQVCAGDTGRTASPIIRLQIRHRCNQLLIRLQINGTGRTAFPALRLQNTLFGPHDFMEEKQENGQLTVRVMTEVRQ